MQVVKFPTCPVDPLAVLLHVLGQLIWVLSVPDSLLTSGLGLSAMGRRKQRILLILCLLELISGCKLNLTYVS